MIGDWVRNIETGKVFQWSLADYIDTNAEYCEPIVLTNEILEANGFKANGYTNLSPDYYLEMKNGFSIYVNLHTTCDKRVVFGVCDRQDIEQREIICYGGRNIHKWHVHDLQHALRLCGLNELADNFKIK